MEQKWSLRLIRLAAIFALFGTYLGSHMSGSGSYQFRPIHAHVLLVGWLSMFAWGIFLPCVQSEISKIGNYTWLDSYFRCFWLNVRDVVLQFKPIQF